MSEGNPIVKCRVSPHTLAQIEDYIDTYNAKQMCRQPIDLSDFIRRAIIEKISKARRSGRKYEIQRVVKGRRVCFRCGQPAELCLCAEGFARKPV